MKLLDLQDLSNIHIYAVVGKYEKTYSRFEAEIGKLWPSDVAYKLKAKLKNSQKSRKIN